MPNIPVINCGCLTSNDIKLVFLDKALPSVNTQNRKSCLPMWGKYLRKVFRFLNVLYFCFYSFLSIKDHLKLDEEMNIFTSYKQLSAVL